MKKKNETWEMDALTGQAYLELVCFKCPTYPDCEGSNMRDCWRRDKETDLKMSKRASEGIKE